MTNTSKSPPVGFPGSASGRLLLSLLLTTPLFLLPYLRLPGIHADALPSIFEAGGHGPLTQFSVAALGIQPLLTAFLLVELLALAVPRLRWRRLNGAWPRRPLTVGALLLGGAIALVNAFFVSLWLEGASDAGLGALVTADGWAVRLPVLVALVGGVAILAACAHAIRRWGLGNGYSWLLAATVVGSLVETVLASQRRIELGDTGPRNLLLSVAVLAAFAWGCHRLARERPWLDVQVAEGLRLQPVLPTSGMAPLLMVSSLLLLVAQLAKLAPSLAVLTEALAPGSTAYLVADLVLLAGAGMLLSLAFYPPGGVLRFFEELAGRLGRTVTLSRAALAPPLRRAAVASVGLLALVPLVHHFLEHRPIYHSPVALLPDLHDWALLVMVLLDLHREWHARRADPSLTAVWELHRLYAVTPIRELLEARGMPVTLRGLQHRRLLYFFGPFVPVELLVPAARAAEAKALIAEWSGLEAVDEPVGAANRTTRALSVTS